MTTRGERFRRSDRLRSPKDYRRISRDGMRLMTPSFVVLVADRPGDGTGAARIGLTVSRRVGSAVVRTRVKRRLRECFRRHRDWFPKGKDFVVIARPSAAGMHLREVEEQLGATLGRLPGRRPS